ncbi:hypothetical protein O3M35_009210 [Rhynocoris fuscipes]|uniref:Mannose-6-phosphate isomerase n=1 Tax=Rhynocoris fuscipes TaxID=488301 RepID=A0AAW1D2Y4_9HEMI
MELKCAIKNYDWGKLGNTSLVAQLAAKNDTTLTISENTPYAELWIGTHPSGDAIVKVSEITLRKYIQNDPSCLGETHSFGNDIPFLLKVLSIRKALSIQVHPNKEQAKRLREQYPKLYLDDNHKPELAIALTDFEALCGFRPLEDVSYFLQNIPELANLIDGDICHSFIKHPSTKLLEQCFASYMTASPVEARRNSAQLIDRLSNSDFSVQESQLADLFSTLNKQFPGDIGLFCIYFLNHVRLRRGEAIYLEAGLPHAYIQGDCVEIMARSDNVVRAGLTPKVRDVNTLLEILKVEPSSAEDMKFQGRMFDKYVYLYKPPIPDFALARICVPEGKTYTLPVLKHASILLVIEGSAECEFFEITRGIAVFLPSEQVVNFTVTSNLEMYQAFPNV